MSHNQKVAAFQERARELESRVPDTLMKDEVRALGNSVGGCNLDGILDAYFKLRENVQLDIELGRIDEKLGSDLDQFIRQDAPDAILNGLLVCFDNAVGT